jgi:hypothetical protein
MSEDQISGIFSIMCPDCGTPLEFHHDAATRTADEVADVVGDDVPDDVRVCPECRSAFVVRFGFAFVVPCPTVPCPTVPCPTERGAA